MNRPPVILSVPHPVIHFREDKIKAHDYYQKGSTTIDRTDTKEVSFEVSEVEKIVINGNTVMLFFDAKGNIHSYLVGEDGYSTVFIQAGNVMFVQKSKSLAMPNFYFYQFLTK